MIFEPFKQIFANQKSLHANPSWLLVDEELQQPQEQVDEAFVKNPAKLAYFFPIVNTRHGF